MNKLKLMDAIIGQIQNDLMTVDQLIQKNSKISSKDNSKRIDLNIYQIGKLRDKIYKIDADLKPDIAKEITGDPDRYHELQGITDQAFQAEENKQFDAAQKDFEKLLLLAHYGHFKQIAEAGLYRVEKAMSTSKKIARNEIKAP